MGLSTSGLARIAQRFPLVARPRPGCQQIRTRITEVEHLAGAAASGGGPLSQAAEAHNKAALIASDCGLPGVARQLCWRQYAVYQTAAPLPAEAAQLALQPIVNLARLLIRDGDGDAAYRLLDSLSQAARNRSSAVLDGHPIAVSELTTSADDHRALCRWLWTVVLADGIRALAAAGRWDQALAHAQQHRGIGSRLLDGRQIAIIAHCLVGDATTALETIRQSTPCTPWEKPVAAALTVLSLKSAGRRAVGAAAIMAEDYLGLGPAPGLQAFHTRLGLTVLDLADDIPSNVPAHLIHNAIASADGYAARDILAHDIAQQHLTEADQQTLSATVASAGLGSGTIPTHLLHRLLSAAHTSEATLATRLAGCTAR
jgi:hypothetical protein